VLWRDGGHHHTTEAEDRHRRGDLFPSNSGSYTDVCGPIDTKIVLRSAHKNDCLRRWLAIWIVHPSSIRANCFTLLTRSGKTQSTENTLHTCWFVRFLAKVGCREEKDVKATNISETISDFTPADTRNWNLPKTRTYHILNVAPLQRCRVRTCLCPTQWVMCKSVRER
jgi:hypothetical protein